MLIDGKTLSSEDEHKSDVLIVGAGAVGLTLGVILARSGKSVMILEAGDKEPSPDYRSRNAATILGKPYRGAREGRMMALGGTTRLWGGQLVPFGPADFAGDPAAGRPAWPINFAEMQPWFTAALALFGIEGTSADQEAVWHRATGRSPAMGGNLRLGMNIWLPQPDFARHFAADIATLDTLRIVTGAQVHAFSWNHTGTQITRVCAHAADRTLSCSAPVIVMANGTLEIVRMLLRTAALAPECALAGNTSLGKGFIDHLHGIVGEIEVEDARKLGAYFDNIYFEGRKYSVKIRASDDFRARHRIANCAASLNANVKVGTMLRDLGMLGRRVLRGEGLRDFGHALRESVTMLRIMAPLIWRYVVERRSTSLFSAGVRLGIELEQIPTAASYLTLDPSLPATDAPIAIKWGFDGREIEAAAALCEEVAKAFEAEGLGKVTIDPRILTRDPAFLDDCHDSYHQMGGARMAESPDEGVVDRDLKVFGTDNLYVLGAATYPSGSFANPTLTAIALAMRLADRLLSNAKAPA